MLDHDREARRWGGVPGLGAEDLTRGSRGAPGKQTLVDEMAPTADPTADPTAEPARGAEFAASSPAAEVGPPAAARPADGAILRMFGPVAPPAPASDVGPAAAGADAALHEAAVRDATPSAAPAAAPPVDHPVAGDRPAAPAAAPAPAGPDDAAAMVGGTSAAAGAGNAVAAMVDAADHATAAAPAPAAAPSSSPAPSGPGGPATAAPPPASPPPAKPTEGAFLGSTAGKDKDRWTRYADPKRGETHGWDVGGAHQVKHSGGLASAAVYAVSHVEGSYDNVQTYDSAVLTFGIMQWTVHAGSLQRFLGYLKDDAGPAGRAAFDQHLGKNGIDVRKQGARYQLYFQGQLHKGAEDFDRLIRADKQTARRWVDWFHALGLDPRAQQAQFEFAKRQFERVQRTELTDDIVDGSLDRCAKTFHAENRGRYGKASDWTSASPKAAVLYFSMTDNNPAYGNAALLKAIDAMYGLHGKDRAAWPKTWPDQFASVLEAKCRETLSNWGDHGSEGRVSKTLRFWNQAERATPSAAPPLPGAVTPSALAPAAAGSLTSHAAPSMKAPSRHPRPARHAAGVAHVGHAADPAAPAHAAGVAHVGPAADPAALPPAAGMAHVGHAADPAAPAHAGGLVDRAEHYAAALAHTVADGAHRVTGWLSTLWPGAHGPVAPAPAPAGDHAPPAVPAGDHAHAAPAGHGERAPATPHAAPAPPAPAGLPKADHSHKGYDRDRQGLDSYGNATERSASRATHRVDGHAHVFTNAFTAIRDTVVFDGPTGGKPRGPRLHKDAQVRVADVSSARAQIIGGGFAAADHAWIEFAALGGHGADVGLGNERAGQAGEHERAEAIRAGLPAGRSPGKSRFHWSFGPGFHPALDGVALDGSLMAKVHALMEWAIHNDMVLGNIVIGSGMRSPKDAHFMCVRYEIAKNGMKRVPLANLQKLPGGRDHDGNLWYQPGWTRELVIANAQAMYGKHSKGAVAAAGYDFGDDRRAPLELTSGPGVSRHCSGHAVDVDIPWRSAAHPDTPDLWGWEQIYHQFGLTRPLHKDRGMAPSQQESWHVEETGKQLAVEPEAG